MPILLLVFCFVSIKFLLFWVHKNIYIYIYIGVFQVKMKNSKKKKKELKSEKKKIYNKTTTGWTVAWFLRLRTLPNTTQFSTFYYFLLQYYFFSPNIYYLLLIFNYFFLFILNHTCLLSSRILHFRLLNFITSSSKLLHLRFAFLLVRLCLLPIPVRHCLFSSFEF